MAQISLLVMNVLQIIWTIAVWFARFVFAIWALSICAALLFCLAQAFQRYLAWREMQAVGDCERASHTSIAAAPPSMFLLYSSLWEC